MSPPLLPNQIQVIVRDWLNANQILLRGRDSTVLVDTGYVTRAPITLALLRENLCGERIDLLVNTHCHSDHMGGNAAVQRAYGCRILVPERHARLIREWDERGLWLAYTGQQADRFAYDDLLVCGETYRWGDLQWRMIGAPGHDAGALVFWCAQERILISGDALWERGFGLVMPEPQTALADAQRTLETIAALRPRIVIPGHGLPFTDVERALEGCFRRVRGWQGDPQRMTLHAFKGMLMFALLDRQSMLLSDLPAYLTGIAFYREFNARYLNLPATAVAQLLVAELEQAGAITRDGDRLLPRARS